ncbi:hypothetical protein CERSUDRAFT_73280 [Gelatoporia subvermispora B]|uniref:DNA helicase n=1 Tax=Ceriporiopsis subvermispora (strain B) TaxID=914234 RepID=M2QZ07_CERS8|nr:hypothetical protein CERSUDRAFT_73280 [Gelatoporia subvermispora B]
MSLGQDAAASRRAALDQLKFKKVQKQQDSTIEHAPSPPSSSTGMSSSSTPAGPPSQSRDATVSSRYFSATPAPSGAILVPSSSPPPSDSSYRWHQSPYQPEDVANGHAGPSGSDAPSCTARPPHADPLSAPSGFANGGAPHASLTRPSGANGRKISEVDGEVDGGPPRKRVNRGSPSSDPADLFSTPDSPVIQRPGHRRKPGGSVAMSQGSSDESSQDAPAGPSTSRIVRGQRAPPPPPTPSSDQSETEARFTRFKMTQPMHGVDVVRAAWNKAGGDVRTASDLLDDLSWYKPPAPQTPRVTKIAVETGRVREVDEALRAQKEAARERGKNSLIYKNRSVLENGKAQPRAVTPPTKFGITDRTASPDVQASPEVALPRSKRPKRKVVESDSEAEAEDVDSEDSARVKRVKDASSCEMRALDYFNSASPEALQEITGCSSEQAKKITELRPFSTVTELNSKLGQGRKKAGPAGISPRMFEDCATIFEGYGRVDSILEDCEQIGAELRADIASWTRSKSKGKARESSTVSSRDTPEGGDILGDGSLSLRSQAVLASEKPKYYLATQPSLLSSTVQLKEYQLLGVNWLNLLYRKRLSCILADEMGLGKTVQVISFFAHLKEQGRKGPHLIVVPSSTLENWCREFSRFAPSISVQTYYAGKEERPQLRQTLNDTMRSRVDGGWEVLITTYNLAQGDAKDRKFFQRVDWDTCVYDEGHVLKNFQSQRYQALLRYEARWRLLLTGTPLQNNLQELVSLMNFILPQQFADDLDSLRAVFKAKGDSKVTLLAQERVSRAKKMMTPFVLRRRKDQVLQDLPKKSERIEWCEMTSLQKSIYNEALQRSRKTVFDLELETEDADTAKVKSTKKARTNGRPKDKMYLENSANVLMDLRKASSHPMLFRRRFTDETLTSIAKLLLKEPDFKKRGARFDYVKEDMQSTRKYLQDDECYLQAGKVKVLLKLLQTYQAQGRRILIFSQFTQILDILQKVLEKQQLRFLVLTGSTPVDVRQSLVDEFTEDESISVFLLSTKAGGMGINLTAASVVIMFDQDFNPHNDKQAQDRAYRIGQKQDVDVVKLITKGSIEEDMLALGQTKLALDEAVAGEEGEEKVEREMKTSLLNVVRKKLQDTGPEAIEKTKKNPAKGSEQDAESELSEVDDSS